MADLQALQRERRRHFLPALLLVLFALAGVALIIGLRPDLLHQPWWQLVIQIALWVLCLLVFPAIGLGMLFPSRGARMALAAAALGLTPLATLGVPDNLRDGLTMDGAHFLGCATLSALYVFLVLALGLLSGAFVQRRSTAAVFWISAGISLTGLNAITWHCPLTDAGHVLPSHLAVAALLMAATSMIGVGVRARAGVRARTG